LVNFELVVTFEGNSVQGATKIWRNLFHSSALLWCQTEICS